MKKDTVNVPTAVLPRQSSATNKNVKKLKVFLSKDKTNNTN